MPSLRQLRVERLLSMRELAEQAGVSLSTIDGIEAGRTEQPNRRVMRCLAAVLGVEPQMIDEFRAAIAAAGQPRPPRRATSNRPGSGWDGRVKTP
jgi:transcriptional regulator with XRE-family HTH domain